MRVHIHSLVTTREGGREGMRVDIHSLVTTREGGREGGDES